jgi:hypothetical protein
MAELADALDLGSNAQKACRFKSCSRHQPFKPSRQSNPAECQDCVRLPVYHSRAGGSHGCSADWAGGWAKRVAVPVIRYDDCIYVRPFKEAAFDYAFILTQMGIAN